MSFLFRFPCSFHSATRGTLCNSPDQMIRISLNAMIFFGGIYNAFKHQASHRQSTIETLWPKIDPNNYLSTKATVAQWYSTFTIILKIFTGPSLFVFLLERFPMAHGFFFLFPRLCASSTACSQRACFARDMTTLAASSWKYANLRAAAVDCGVLTKKLHSLDSLIRHHGISLVPNDWNMSGFKMILVSTMVWIPRWCLCSRSLLSKSLQLF